MRRLPHSATLLRPSKVRNAYGDLVDGPLASHGAAFPAWKQTESSTETTPDGVVVIATRHRLHVFHPGPDLVEGDVVDVAGERFAIKGELIRAVNPRGRGRFAVVDLTTVSRGVANG